MRKVMMLAATALAITSLDARAQTDLSAYTDANGYLDVQKLTCAQLAGTWQEDADKLMVWYSGWYNGLAKKHFFHPSRGVRLEHEVIVHCKANSDIRVIDAIAVILVALPSPMTTTIIEVSSSARQRLWLVRTSAPAGSLAGTTTTTTASGGGVEYAFTNNLTVKLEGLWVNLDRGNNDNSGFIAGGVVGVTNQGAPINGEAFGFGNRRNDEGEFFVARGGVNYKCGTF